jgi:NDP-sugar pyrophosphorylase family protein
MLAHELAMLVIEVCNKKIGGEVLVDEDGTFKGMNEPKHYVERGLVNTGMYMLSKSIFSIDPVRISPDSPEFGLPHTLLSLADFAPVDVVRTERWFQVTEPDDLKRAEDFLK